MEGEEQALREDAEERRAALAAQAIDCRLQVAESQRQASELLQLLSLPVAKPASGRSSAASECRGASSAASDRVAEADGAGEADEGNVVPPQHPGSRDTAAAHCAALQLQLPAERQLARTPIPAAQVDAFLTDLQARYAVAAERLEMRGKMLKVGRQSHAPSHAGDTDTRPHGVHTHFS